MSLHIETIALKPDSLNTTRSVTVRRYGQAGARPKVYLQASLHADEIPAQLVAHHLARLLDEADRRGAIKGEIILVPQANPIGAGQVVNGMLLGRYELGGAGNFNRRWPDLTEGVADRVASQLGNDPDRNVDIIRTAMKASLDTRQAGTQTASLKLALARLAFDADLVLDLHCDNQALVHLFTSPALWPALADLSADIGSVATLLAADSGGASFDEAFSMPWTQLAKSFPDKPIPSACQSATVEYRGLNDVDDALNQADAKALFRFLQRRGVIAGDPGPLPQARCDATPLEATDIVRAPVPGVIAYKVAMGEQVKKGQLVAEMVDPTAADPARARTPVYAGTDGLVLSLRLDRLVGPGASVVKIVGREPLAYRQGLLLED